MLVLSRKCGERVRIGNDTTLVVLEVRGNRIRLGIEAPGQVHVLRAELLTPQAVVVGCQGPKVEELHHAAGNP